MQSYPVTMPSWTKSEPKTLKISVLLFDQFSNHCLANAVEPLRAANMLSGRPLYDLQYLTLSGAVVRSSSGMQITPHGKLGAADGDILFVMPSYGFLAHSGPTTSAALRSATRRFPQMAGFDTGSWLMAEAGLLAGCRATIHWEVLDRFAERFPDIDVQKERFVIDGPRLTCSGAMTAFDLVLRMIADRSGEALRIDVATLFMSPGVGTDLGTFGTSTEKTVSRVLAIMQDNLEDPLPIAILARRVGRSQKDLQGKITAALGATPQTVYRRLRLVLARKLVSETDLPVAEIAVRSGYQNASAMTRAFRVEFGISPRAMRQPA